MSTSITSATTKQKEPLPVDTSPPATTKEKKPAIQLNAQPSTSGPADVKAFYDARTQPTVSAACEASARAGAAPGEVAAACTVREFMQLANAPKGGLTPVETDVECVSSYDKEGAAWGEALGEEAKDLIKKAPIPVVRHRVAKAVKEALQEVGKDVGHTQGTADCKVVSDPAAFAKNYAPVTVANQSSAPAVSTAASNYDFTPAVPEAAACTKK